MHRNYAAYAGGSRRAAEAVSGHLCRWFAPDTVVDVGCGAGTWMDAFRARGCPTVHGIDGPWSPLAGRSPDVTTVDFTRTASGEWSRLRRLPRYDLVVSVEVAEHLPPALADDFVAFLAGSGDVVAFSAAIPLQGGQNHVNEQWPDYWIARFAAHGLAPFDILRLALWDDASVPAWYRQNLILFLRGEIPPMLREEGERLALTALHAPRALVHPAVYARRLGRILLALSRPHRFLAMLLRERRTGVRETPRLP